MYDVHTITRTLQYVDNQSRATLLLIIEQMVLPGSEIHSDCWPAYRAINSIPVIPNYEHKIVNHKRHFVDPITGVYTNKVEKVKLLNPNTSPLSELQQ